MINFVRDPKDEAPFSNLDVKGCVAAIPSHVSIDENGRA